MSLLKSFFALETVLARSCTCNLDIFGRILYHHRSARRDRMAYRGASEKEPALFQHRLSSNHPGRRKERDMKRLADLFIRKPQDTLHGGRG